MVEVNLANLLSIIDFKSESICISGQETAIFFLTLMVLNGEDVEVEEN